MKKILYLSISLLLSILFVQCEKEDMFDKYSPEILYKRYVQTQSGMQWQYSPDAIDVTLGANETEYTVYSRVSSPNGLTKVVISEVVNGVEKEVITHTADEDIIMWSPNQIELAQKFTNITATKITRITATDAKNHTTVRDFTIKK